MGYKAKIAKTVLSEWGETLGNKLFGKNVYLNSVIFDGNENDIGKIVKVNVENTNQNTLFGKIKNKMKAA